MSYEFKKINEVEILETVSDEAHVLVEEDGAIRRAPKTEVGGAGGEIDGIIYNTTIPNYVSTDSASVVNFDFTTIKEKFLAGKEIAVMLHSVFSYGNDYEAWDKSLGVSYNSTANTISIAWLTTSSYASGNAGMMGITITIDSSGSIVDVYRA